MIERIHYIESGVINHLGKVVVEKSACGLLFLNQDKVVTEKKDDVTCPHCIRIFNEFA
jgi:hypothetical protein